MRQGCDAVFLDLHGAMVVEDYDDAEGEILRRVRAIAPRVPIAVTFDYHTNLSPETVALATLNAQGKLRQIREIAIVGGTLNRRAIHGSSPVRPCGRCRQVMTEAAQLALRDIIVHCASADLSVVEKFWLSDLLPLPFGPSDMGLVQDD